MIRVVLSCFQYRKNNFIRDFIMDRNGLIMHSSEGTMEGFLLSQGPFVTSKSVIYDRDRIPISAPVVVNGFDEIDLDDTSFNMLVNRDFLVLTANSYNGKNAEYFDILCALKRDIKFDIDEIGVPYHIFPTSVYVGANNEKTN